MINGEQRTLSELVKIVTFGNFYWKSSQIFKKNPSIWGINKVDALTYLY